MHPAEDDLRCTLCNVSHSCWRRQGASLSGRNASGGAMRQAPIKARNCISAQQVCVLCRATQQHTAVALVYSRLNMVTRRALATLRHLIRQASHALWHVCGTGLPRITLSRLRRALWSSSTYITDLGRGFPSPPLSCIPYRILRAHCSTQPSKVQ